METYYRAVFHYNGKKPNKFICDEIESKFVYFHNAFAAMVNPRMEAWNAEYDGPNDGVDENGCINIESNYNKFIISKFQPYADKLTKTLGSLSFIKRFLIGEECDLELELKNGTIVDMCFEEVNL